MNAKEIHKKSYARWLKSVLNIMAGIPNTLIVNNVHDWSFRWSIEVLNSKESSWNYLTVNLGVRLCPIILLKLIKYFGMHTGDE